MSLTPLPSRPNRARWQAFAVCVVAAAVTMLDMSKINVAIPSIEHSLGAGPTEIQLIVAGYALAFGLTLVPSGRLGDLYSRKAMFVVGLSMFTVISLLCALAPTIEVLVLARMLQGIAGGMLMPQVIGMIQVLFTGGERGRAFGTFGAVTGLSTAFGPALGGLLLEIGDPVEGWRWLFWINVPFCVGALLFAIRMLPSASRSVLDAPIERRSLDLVGIGLLGVTVFCLMLPFVLTSGSVDDDPRRWYWVIGFVIGGALFVWWELRYLAIGKSPLVHFGLFRLSSYRNGILIATAHMGASPALFLLIAVTLQNGMGYSPLISGMVSLPLMILSSVTAWIAGRLTERFGAKLVLFGVISSMLGYALIVLIATTADRDIVPFAVAPGMVLLGIGFGFVISPNQTITLSQVPVADGGVAGSVGQVGQRLGSAVGIAIGAATFYAVLNTFGGAAADVDAYRTAFLVGTGAAGSLMLVSLVMAVADLRAERRR